jgi:CheY-like chemotaxis protein/chemotaxis protein CheY-P-specific phosphatase CheC
MQTFPKLHEMLKSALSQAAQECGALLGQQLEVRETVSLKVKRDAYLSGLENASFVVGLESQYEYKGTFYLVFTLRDAITLSGTLLGIPAGRIQEKKRLAIIEADDVDAFSEIANQVTGSFNTVYKQSLPRKVHLKQLALKKFIPDEGKDEAEALIADGDYYQLRVHLDMPGQDLERVDLLIPLPLARIFDLQEHPKEEQDLVDGAGEAVPEGEEAPDDSALKPGMVLILDDNEDERQQLQDILAASGINPVAASLDKDMEMLSREGVQAVLLGFANAGEQELSLCIKIKAHSREMSIPIIMCARQWTRTGVLKALKYGARDIVLKTSPPLDLATRVMKLVNSA